MECPFTKQATEAFQIFDHENTETLDVREVGYRTRIILLRLLYILLIY